MKLNIEGVPRANRKLWGNASDARADSVQLKTNTMLHVDYINSINEG
jgi:hypothetical protein